MPFFYEMSMTIPAGTTRPNAVRSTEITLPRGSLIDGMDIHVPAGHEGEVPVWVERDRAQILPNNAGEIRLDDVSAFPLLGENAKLAVPQTAAFSLVGYNDDAVNAHTTRLFIRGRYAHELSDEERARYFLPGGWG